MVTYFFQHQREQVADGDTGEVFIKTHPQDIELAFTLLKSNLFRRADELSTSARGFYNWLKGYLKAAKTKQFTTRDIRKAKPIHPRTLNRYLQELILFDYVQVVGGNKHREGYRYKLTEFGNLGGKHGNIEKSIAATLKTYGKPTTKSRERLPVRQAEKKTQRPNPKPPKQKTPNRPKKESPKSGCA